MGLKPSANQGKARLRGLHRIIYSKTISPPEAKMEHSRNPVKGSSNTPALHRPSTHQIASLHQALAGYGDLFACVLAAQPFFKFDQPIANHRDAQNAPPGLQC